MQIGGIGAALAFGSLFYGGRRGGRDFYQDEIACRSVSVFIDEYPLRYRRVWPGWKRYITHEIAPKAETKRARRRRSGREKAERRLAFRQALARCSK